MSAYEDVTAERGPMSAWEDVAAERARQDEQWGPQNHAPVLWMAVIAEEVGEAAQQAVKARFTLGDDNDEMRHLWEYRAELVQVAAVAIAAIEAWDRATWEWDCLRTRPVEVES